MKDRILQTLSDLRTYALSKGIEAALDYHEEDSSLMRFANSAISLNTHEHLIRLKITAYTGKKRAGYELITDLSKLDEMKQGIDIATEMSKHAQALTYQPTIPAFTQSFADEAGSITTWDRSATKKSCTTSTRPWQAWKRTRSSCRASFRTA